MLSPSTESSPRMTPLGGGFPMACPEGDDLVGLEVASLRVERLLAEGGMGSVYAAREAVSGERVALKVLQRRHAADPGLVSRFEREIRFGQRIDHPNVARLRRAGALDDGRPFFTMDLHDGTTLGALVRDVGPLGLRRGLEIADGVLAALEAVHASGIVHRDLQPDNVLLGRRSGVKLVDFGFAHEEGVDTGDGLTPDSPGALVGTLTFMSPEQATRSRALTVRSDLFAAGLLLYYALSGKLPFRGAHDLDVVVAIVRAAPVPLRRERRDVPRALDAVLARALAKHPDARFESAREMRAALAQI